MILKDQAIRGVKWSGFARGCQQVSQIIVTIILTRLLVPADFGLVAMALVFTGLIAVFNVFGTGSAIIQKQNLTDDDLSSIFWFNVGFGILTTALTILLYPVIAAFYGADVLASLISVMAFGFLFTSVANVQLSLAKKEMNFKKLSIVDVASTVSGGIVAVVMAYRGFGAWSLVWQGLVATMITTLFIWMTSRWKPSFKFNINSIKSIMGYSLNLLGAGVVSFFSRNVDHLLIGRFLGPEWLGYYTLAYRLMLYPLENLSHVVSQVLFPAFSFIQVDNERFREAYLKATKYIAFITFLMMFGLFWGIKGVVVSYAVVTIVFAYPHF